MTRIARPATNIPVRNESIENACINLVSDQKPANQKPS